MRHSILWLAAGMVAVSCLPRLAGADLSIKYPPGGTRKGVLALTAAAPASFEPGEPADGVLTVTHVSGPASHITAGKVSYTFGSGYIQAETAFCRDRDEDVRFSLSFKVVGRGGQQLTFDSKEAVVNRLKLQPGENPDSDSCAAPAAPSPPVDVRLETWGYSNSGLSGWLPFGSAWHKFTGTLTGNQPATVVFQDAEWHQPVSQAFTLKGNGASYSADVVFFVRLGDYSRLAVSDTKTAKQYGDTVDVPRLYGPFGPGQAFLLSIAELMLLVTLLAVLYWKWEAVRGFYVWIVEWVRGRIGKVLPIESVVNAPPAAPDLHEEKKEIGAESLPTKAQVEGCGKEAPAKPIEQPERSKEPAPPQTTVPLEVTQPREVPDSRKESLPIARPEPVPSAPAARTWSDEDTAAALVAVLNAWWSEVKPVRSRLTEMLNSVGLPAQFFAMSEIEGSMGTPAWNGPYAFQPSEKDGGWLWVDRPYGRAIALPADPNFFYTPATLKILDRVIYGCEDLDIKPRFKKASSVCQLARADGSSGKYVMSERGVIWLEGRPKPKEYSEPGRVFESFLPQPAPPPPTPEELQTAAVRARAEADKARADADRVRAEADKTRADADLAKAMADQARAEADHRQADAFKDILTATQKRDESDRRRAEEARYVSDVMKEALGLLRKIDRSVQETGMRLGPGAATSAPGAGGQHPNAGLPSRQDADILRQISALQDGLARVELAVAEIPRTPAPLVAGKTGDDRNPAEPERTIAAVSAAVEKRIAAFAQSLASSPVAALDDLRKEITAAVLGVSSDLSTLRSDVSALSAKTDRAAAVLGTVPDAVAVTRALGAQLERVERALLERNGGPAQLREQGREMDSSAADSLPVPAAAPPKLAEGSQWWSQERLESLYRKLNLFPDTTYQQRLQSLRQALAASFPEVEFTVSHLSFQSGKGFQIHATRVSDAGKIECEKCTGVSDAQFVVTARTGRKGEVQALLPPWRGSKYAFTGGYEMLLGALPDPFTVRSVSQPATLVKSQGDVYKVGEAQHMKWAD